MGILFRRGLVSFLVAFSLHASRTTKAFSPLVHVSRIKAPNIMAFKSSSRWIRSSNIETPSSLSHFVRKKSKPVKLVVSSLVAVILLFKSTLMSAIAKTVPEKVANYDTKFAKTEKVVKVSRPVTVGLVTVFGTFGTVLGRKVVFTRNRKSTHSARKDMSVVPDETHKQSQVTSSSYCKDFYKASLSKPIVMTFAETDEYLKLAALSDQSERTHEKETPSSSSSHDASNEVYNIVDDNSTLNDQTNQRTPINGETCNVRNTQDGGGVEYRDLDEGTVASEPPSTDRVGAEYQGVQEATVAIDSPSTDQTSEPIPLNGENYEERDVENKPVPAEKYSIDPSSKYETISDPGERAFNILLDLGMIKPTPDIDDPKYNHSLDDDLAPENIFQ